MTQNPETEDTIVSSEGDTLPAPDNGTAGAPSHESGPRAVSDRPCEDFRESLTGGLIPPGTRLGRYVILDRIGQGGMGAVYAAYDPQLDRRIALKFLHAGNRSHDSESKARLLREAQAMARLSHPNVVTVHDAGEHEGVVFISMEYVDGESLRGWINKGPRGWQAVLDIFLSAGEGLAAAHGAGLVHRDFKMENVFIDRQGRARVGDFGFARPANTSDLPVQVPAVDCARDLPPISQSLLHTPLTVEGGIVGTPGYMAPEQIEGLPVDARSDQFSFCVCLYESLWGIRPFMGSTLAALLLSIRQGPAVPPKDSRIPPHIRDAVVRGLSAIPSDRHSSMRDLLAALSYRRPTTTLSLQLAAILAVVASIAVALLAWRLNPSTSLLCQGAQRRLDGIWDSPRKGQIKEAFEKANKPFAGDAWRSVSRGVDDYSAAWTSAHREACEATRLRGEQSETSMDLRMICLESRLQHLRALLSAFAAADETTVAEAINAVHSLPPVATCSDLQALSAGNAIPPNHPARQKLDQVHAKIMEADALLDVGQSGRALDITRSLLDEVQSLNYAPTEAELLFSFGRALDETADYRQAEQAYARAAARALSGQVNEVLVRALSKRGAVAGVRLARFEEGDAWNRLAAAAAERLTRNDELLGLVENTFGALDVKRGNSEGALAHFDKARALLQRVLPADHMRLVDIETNKGIATSRLGRHEEAIGHHKSAVAMLERTVGPHHPKFAEALMNLGVACRRLERLDDALGYYQRALAVYQDAFGPDNVRTLAVLNNTAIILGRQGKYQDALVVLARVRSGRERGYGPEHPLVASADLNIGFMLRRLGQFDQALAAFRSAVRIDENALGAQHRSTANARASEAESLLRKMLLAEALAAFQRALVVLENDKETPPNELASALQGLAETYLEMHQPTVALPLAERAARAIEGQECAPSDVAQVKLTLARALWDSHGDRGRARRLASDAGQAVADTGPGYQEERTRVAAWLAAHP